MGFKLLALFSAVALGSGYVWWSQKQSEERRAREEATQELERAVLPGSKSAWGASSKGHAPRKDVEDERTNADFIAPISEGDSGVGQATPPEEDKEDYRPLLPGPKSIGRLLPAPEPEPEKEKDQP